MYMCTSTKHINVSMVHDRQTIPISLYSLVLLINSPESVAPITPNTINNEPHRPAAFCREREGGREYKNYPCV